MVYSARCSKFTQLHGQAGIVLRYKQRYNFGENALTDLSFGAWLKRQRKASDLTQEQLADQVGCSAIAIRKIEAEERRPSAQIAERLAQIFNIPKNEQKTFRDFARGNIASAPKDTVKDIPWRATRVNLPATVTSLIGRAEELALIRDYLLDPNIRLITLIGPPGIGKTRLSLEAARTATIEFTDGVFFAALAPLDDPSLIPSAVIQALGYFEAKSQDLFIQFTDRIGDKHILLVLDNCEHLIEDIAPFASRLLSACPRLKIIATSRESLRIPGEWLYYIPTLNVPKESSPVDVASAASFPALILFAERARAVRADFMLTAENVQAVIAICAKLDGLPLAIELIATRIRFMSPQALLERLTDSFIFSADGMRAVSARQKTLNNAIGWSYSFLLAEEQKLLLSLSVFSGGFTLKSVESIFSGMVTGKSMADLVASLSDKSLLQRALDMRGETRFNMLVTIQQFALDRLRNTGDETNARNQHLIFFLDLAERGDKEMRGPSQVRWADLLENEHDNFHAALDWAVSNQKTESALRLLCALGWPWEVRSHYTEALGWLNKIRTLPDVSNYPLILARTLNHIGRYLWTQENIHEAQSILEESRAISLKLGVEGELCLAETLNWLGLVVDDANTTRAILEEGLELNQKWENERGVALSTFHMGILENHLNHADTALSLLEKSLALFRQFGDLFFISRVSLFLGHLFLKQENYDKTRHFFEEHLRIDTEIQFWDGIAEGWRDLGDLHYQQGDLEKAELYYEQGRVVCREHGLIKKMP